MSKVQINKSASVQTSSHPSSYNTPGSHDQSNVEKSNKGRRGSRKSDLNKFLVGSASESIKPPPQKYSYNITKASMIGYRLAKCLAIQQRQRKILIQKGLSAFKFARISQIPSAVVYSMDHEITEDSVQVAENQEKTKTLCRALNTICAFKMRQMLEHFHHWRLYSFYVKKIDPETFNPHNASRIQENFENSDETQPPRLTRIKEIAAGLGIMNTLYLNRARAGFTKILFGGKLLHYNKLGDNFKAHNAISAIIKHINMNMRSYLTAWRNKVSNSSRDTSIRTVSTFFLLLLITS